MGQSIKLQDNSYWDVSSIRTVKNVTAAGTNLDNYLTTGCYYFDSDRKPVNIPSGTNGWLQVIAEQPMNEGRGSGYVKQIWHRSGDPATTGYDTFIRTANIGQQGFSAWKRLIIEDDIFYKAGDTYTNRTLVYAGGHVTSGSETICATINVPKRMDKISTITVNSYEVSARSVSGSYLLNQATSGLTVTAAKADGCNVRLHFNAGSAYSVTNNTPVSVAIYGLKLTFT